MGGRGSGRGQGAEAGPGRGWAFLTNVKGGRGTHAARSAPGAWHPALTWAPPKVGRPTISSPLPWRRGVLGLPRTLHPFWPAQRGLWPLTAHGGPSRELVSADPALSPKAPKFPRNTSSPLEGGHPGRPQTKNPGHRGLPTPRGPGEPAASGGAVEPATAPRVPAALRGSPRRGSPEPASLQCDQSAKRDLPGPRGRRAESWRSPLES